MSQRREVYYQGHVQGVGFRWTTSRIARRHAVTGHVRNLADGRVELIVEGEAEELDRFLGAVRAALGDHIRHTEQTTLPAEGGWRTFEIRR